VGEFRLDGRRKIEAPHSPAFQSVPWKGWWGDNPPYHAPTFVLTHCEREPLVMEGDDFLSRRARAANGTEHVATEDEGTRVLQYFPCELIVGVDNSAFLPVHPRGMSLSERTTDTSRFPAYQVDHSGFARSQHRSRQ
jgi:hypothetical protein